MTATSIRHTRNGRNYRAPVLLDQRSLLRLALVMSLFLIVIFMSGYLLGFQKAEARLGSPVARVALSLPEPVSTELAAIEPYTPEQIEPGESIDVDTGDDVPRQAAAASPPRTGPARTTPSEHGPGLKPAGKAAQVVAEVKALSAQQMGMGGPAASDPGQPVESTAASLYDNATRETARFSIQVGMYSQLDNAENRVEELASAELTAYIDEYINGGNKTRYNVRFGYFADHRSAREALETYEQKMAGSGYIVNLQTAKTAL